MPALGLEVAQYNVVGIVAVHIRVLKPVQINSAWPKKYILIPRSTFYDARELSYTMKWPCTIVGIGANLKVLNPVKINSAGSKINIWAPKSFLHNASEPSNTVKWTLPRLLALLLVLLNI